jgi:hypothetical protein
MARAWWFGLAIAALGCSGQALVVATGAPDAGAEVGGGPRIVPWQLEATGTPALVVGAFDTKAGVHCRFLPAEDGQLRCLPSSQEPIAFTNKYADSACQQPVYRTTAARARVLAGRPTAVPLPRSNCEPRRYAVAMLQVRADDGPFFAQTPCAPLVTPWPHASADEVDLVAVATLPPDRWAAGTEVDGEVLGGGVLVRQVAAEDGARFDDHLVFGQLGTCRLSGLSGLACEPINVLMDRATGGADCSGPFVWRADACSQPAYILGSSPSAVGPKWTGAVSLSYHGCDIVDAARGGPDGPDEYYEQGMPINEPVVATLNWASAGTGRLVLRGLAADHGQFVGFGSEIAPPAGWEVPRYFDSSARRDCDPWRTPDGVVRCLSGYVLDLHAASFTLFSDGTCTKPAYVCGTGPCEGTWADRSVISLDVDANGEPHVTAVNVMQDLKEAFVSNSGGCMSATTMFGPGFNYMTLGDPLPWDQFPVIAEINGRPSGAP